MKRKVRLRFLLTIFTSRQLPLSNDDSASLSCLQLSFTSLPGLTARPAPFATQLVPFTGPHARIRIPGARVWYLWRTHLRHFMSDALRHNKQMKTSMPPMSPDILRMALRLGTLHCSERHARFNLSWRP